MFTTTAWPLPLFLEDGMWGQLEVSTEKESQNSKAK
jgi:hypothetical protein